MVSQLIGIAEFADSVDEYFVLVLILRRRSEVLGSSCITFKSNVISLHFLDIVSGEPIVAQQLVVGLEGGLHGVFLYPGEAVQVRVIALGVESLPPGILRPISLHGVCSSSMLGFCFFQ